MSSDILLENIGTVRELFPFVVQYFTDYGMAFPDGKKSLMEVVGAYPPDFFEDIGISKEQLLLNFSSFLKIKTDVVLRNNMMKISSVTILGGKNKVGELENIRVELTAGSITSIVGPTGSGKSRLLADIEWLAKRDTPTGRVILVDGKEPDVSKRFSLEHKLVAQLSQNMNFVMDATVGEFLLMHAGSRLIANPEMLIEEVLRQANLLAGECFTFDTPLTALSGGQSRALMIADTALLCTSPVVLIDEIENAGIDRRKALQLLVKSEKVILIATHDPVLALMADRRLVIRNGGIARIIITSEEEKNQLRDLELMDEKMQKLRDRLRQGERIYQQ